MVEANRLVPNYRKIIKSKFLTNKNLDKNIVKMLVLSVVSKKPLLISDIQGMFIGQGLPTKDLLTAIFELISEYKIKVNNDWRLSPDE